MKITAKRISIMIASAVIIACMASQGAHAASPVTIDGLVTDKGKIYPGAVVVAWCGDLSHFGGSDTTNASGHYLINTNSDDCPLGSDLTVTTDTDYDGISDGAAHAPTHTSTTVSILLGTYTTIAIPEYDWFGAGIALVTGIGIITFRRRAHT